MSNYNNDYHVYFNKALEEGNFKTILDLLDTNSNDISNDNKGYAFWMAAQQGQLKVVEDLLSSKR